MKNTNERLGLIEKGNSMKEKIIRKGILAVALILILTGIMQNDFTDIKNKAIHICYECIGIG